MISELIRIAELNGITGWEAHRRYPIHWFIELDSAGHVVGFSPTAVSSFTKNGERKDSRGKKFTVPANYHMQWKNEKVQSVCTNDSNWLPDFLCGPANEIFPAGVAGDQIYRLREVVAAVRRDGAKHPDRNRLCKLGLWRRLVFKAERENGANLIIKAIANFIRDPHKLRFSDLPVSFAGDVGQRSLESIDEGNETISFRVNGRIAVADPELRRWWADQVRKQRAEVGEHLTVGRDAYEPGEGRITEYFPTVFSSVPFASFGSATFTSYGLGSQTATMRLETAEKLAAGLNWLLLHDDSSLKLADETAVFWTVSETQEGGNARASAVPFVRLLEKADTLAVRDFLRGIWGGRPLQIDAGRFCAATFCPAGKGRFSVRSWHTDTLPRAQENLKNWFNALSLNSSDGGTPTLNQLAEATISKAKRQKAKPAPATYSALFESALFGRRLPHQLFAAAIARQKTELAKGRDDKDPSAFERRLQARTSLIQAFFALKQTNGETPMNHQTILDPKCDHPAILCGRLLTLLDKIHNEAHTKRNEAGKTISRGTASSPAGRFYAAASATPALAFPQLLKLARYHLDKIGGGWAYRLEFGWRDDEDSGPFDALATVVDRLKTAAGGSFPRLLSLEDQGRFALGFYHERCRKWPVKSEPDRQSETSTPTA